MASLYSALKRRRLAFSGTSGSGGLGMLPGSTLVRGAVIVTVMSWEYSLSPSSVNREAEVSQLMLAGRAGPLMNSSSDAPLSGATTRLLAPSRADSRASARASRASVEARRSERSCVIFLQARSAKAAWLHPRSDGDPRPSRDRYGRRHAQSTRPSPIRYFNSQAGTSLRAHDRSVGPSSWPCLTTGCARGAGCGGSKPQRDPGRLHGLINDGKELGGEGVEVDLIA